MREVVRESRRDDAAASKREHLDTRDPEPAWLRGLVLGLAAAVVSFGLIGLGLAVVGWFRPWLVFPLGTLASAALFAVGWDFVPGPRSRLSSQAIAIIGVAAIACVTFWNAGNASQHVYINRDGGSYANTGLWIARHGDLVVPAAKAPFAKEPSLSYESFAVFARPDGSLQFQFAHLLPAVLAAAYAIGGSRALFYAPELLSGIALLAFFLLTWRLFRRPALALAATFCIALVIPQVSFSRDSYSEIPTQIFVFAALALLVDTRRFPRPKVAFVAGLFLGATQATRIDGLALLIGVPLVLAIAWLATDEPGSRASVGWFVAGVAPGVAIGLFDVARRSHDYFAAESKHMRSLALAIAIVALIGLVVIALARPIARAAGNIVTPTVASAAGIVVIVLGFAGWFVRPHVQHIVVDQAPKYFERSLVWMSWYLGPITLAAAIVAAGLLARSLLLGRSRHALAPVLVLAPASALYLWKALAAPDHVWVDRRFLVSAIPLFVMLAFGLAASLVGLPTRPQLARAVRALVGLFVVVALAYPLSTLRGISAMSEQRGALAVVEDACHLMGPRPAVVVLKSPTGIFDQWTPQTFRGWCDAEVAIVRGKPDTAALRRIAADWRALGRTTYVVADTAQTISTALPRARVSSTRRVTSNALEHTLTRRPSRLVHQSFQIAVAAVNPS
jgi:hypothetical protein